MARSPLETIAIAKHIAGPDKRNPFFSYKKKPRKVFENPAVALEAKRRLVEQAIADLYPGHKVEKADVLERFKLGMSECPIWLKSLTEDTAIFQRPGDGNMAGVRYSITDGKVTLGEPFPLELQL